MGFGFVYLTITRTLVGMFSLLTPEFLGETITLAPRPYTNPLIVMLRLFGVRDFALSAFLYYHKDNPSYRKLLLEMGLFVDLIDTVSFTVALQYGMSLTTYGIFAGGAIAFAAIAIKELYFDSKK